MQEMWNKIFTPELVFKIRELSGETEDFDTMSAFIKHIKQRVDYKQVVMLAVKWKTYDDIKQANLAINFAGIFHASRFILLMDCLSDKFIEGKLN